MICVIFVSQFKLDRILRIQKLWRQIIWRHFRRPYQYSTGDRVGSVETCRSTAIVVRLIMVQDETFIAPADQLQLEQVDEVKAHS